MGRPGDADGRDWRGGGSIGRREWRAVQEINVRLPNTVKGTLNIKADLC